MSVFGDTTDGNTFKMILSILYAGQKVVSRGEEMYTRLINIEREVQLCFGVECRDFARGCRATCALSTAQRIW